MLVIDDEVCGARLPAAALASLAPLRTEPTLRIAQADGSLWLRWAPGRLAVVRALLPLPGAQFFVQRDGRWHRFGAALPAWDFAESLEYHPLDRVLFPAPMSVVQPTTSAIEPRRLGVQRDDQPRATTALLCPVEALLAWSDNVPGVQLQKLRAAALGKQLLVIGAALPLLPTGARFWGKRVLLPLGVRPDPDLPESALIEAAGLAKDELLLHHDDAWEAVPTACLERVTRAGLKLLARGTP